MAEPTPEPDEPQAAPVAPQGPPPVLKPSRRDALDAELERELEAALAGFDDKALYGEPQKKPSGGRPPAEGARQPAERGLKKGRVISIHGDDVFVDVGGRSQGVLSAAQFDERPALGDEVEVTIEGYDDANGLLLLARKGAAVQADWSSVAEGMVVEARVTGANKGGLEVDVNGIRGFIPISQIDLYRVEDTKPYLNQKLRCQVLEVNPAERNLVVSRRELLQREREEAKEKLWAELEEGQIRSGVVRGVKEFGAFIDLGGVDGLLHVSEMSWSRVSNVADLLQPGQRVDVAVVKIDRERRKITLGLKQLQKSPWEEISTKYSTGSLVAGKVTKLMEFGAFVELEPGVEGLIHISELSPQRVRRVGDVVQPGQEVQVRILQIQSEQKRISLSLKAAQPEPGAEPADASAAEEPKRPLPPRKGILKGGL